MAWHSVPTFFGLHKVILKKLKERVQYCTAVGSLILTVHIDFFETVSTVVCTETMTHVTALLSPCKSGKRSHCQMLKHINITLKSLHKQILRFIGLLVFC